MRPPGDATAWVGTGRRDCGSSFCWSSSNIRAGLSQGAVAFGGLSATCTARRWVAGTLAWSYCLLRFGGPWLPTAAYLQPPYLTGRLHVDIS